MEALLTETSDMFDEATLQSSSSFFWNGRPFSLDLSSALTDEAAVDDVVEEGRELCL